MLGLYGAYSLIEALGRTPLGFWSAVILAALAVGLVGVVIEIARAAPHLPRARAVPAARHLRHRADHQGRGAASLGLGGSGRSARARPHHGRSRSSDSRIPIYDLLLIVIGPVVLGLLWLLLAARAGARWCARRPRTARWWARSASTRPSCSPRCSSSARCWPGLGGALQIPREPANLDMDLSVIADAFVVTVVGGLGSLGGAFLAAVLIGVAKAFCIGCSAFSKLTLVVEFVIMGAGAGDAALRPARQAAGHGARGRRAARRRCSRRAAGRCAAWLVAVRCSCRCSPTATSPCC